MNPEILEQRLIDYAVLIIEVINELPRTKSNSHLTNQLIKSASSTALNYGEARSGESRKDFVHKLQIVLKELRESYISLHILSRSNPDRSTKKMKTAISETNELISIFVKSVNTAQRNSTPINR